MSVLFASEKKHNKALNMGIKIRVKHLKLARLTKYEKELAQRGEKISTNVFPAFTTFCISLWLTTAIAAQVL